MLKDHRPISTIQDDREQELNLGEQLTLSSINHANFRAQLTKIGVSWMMSSTYAKCMSEIRYERLSLFLFPPQDPSIECQRQNMHVSQDTVLFLYIKHFRYFTKHYAFNVHDQYTCRVFKASRCISNLLSHLVQILPASDG